MLMWSHCLFRFCCLCFSCHTQEFIANIHIQELSPMFSSRSLCFQVLNRFMSLIYFESIFCGTKIGIQFHSFACKYPVFLTAFTEKTILTSLSILASLVKHSLTVHAWVYFWALSSVNCLVCLFSHHCHNVCFYVFGCSRSCLQYM